MTLNNILRITGNALFWQAKYSTNGCRMMSQLVDYYSFDKIIIDRIDILSYKIRNIECDTKRKPAWTL